MARGGIGFLRATYQNLKTPGLHGDGGNLYLQVSVGPAGNLRRSWIFRYQLKGRKPRDMGLGPISDVTLVEAREIARQYRKLVKEGVDPIEERNARIARNLAANATVMTFDQAAESYMRQHRAGWTPDHAAQWASSLKTHVSPVIGKMSVADINTTHVMKVLEPLWREKTETASRVRGRVESVLGWATVSGYRAGDNPARWRGHLGNLLARRSKVRAVKHHPALAYAEMSDFMQELRARRGMAALALEFAVLTCVRSADVFNARHADIDRTSRTWTIPAFSKTGKPHRVPLSAAALAAFDKARKIVTEIGGRVGGSEFAFPNDVTGARLSQNAMLHVLNRMGRAGVMTTHGCRASFRTWAQERTNFAWELAEMALGHQVGDVVERAYARGDAFKKRVAIMEAWANFLATPTQPATVIPLARAGA
jgi:integrase